MFIAIKLKKKTQPSEKNLKTKCSGSISQQLRLQIKASSRKKVFVSNQPHNKNVKSKFLIVCCSFANPFLISFP